MTLNAIEAIFTRHSCRAFRGEMPQKGDLERIAQAAMAAPSAMNRQPWRVVVLTNQELMTEMDAEGMRNIAALPDQALYERMVGRGGTLYYHAPCMMFVLTPKAAPSPLDCGILTENIALAASGLGMDSLICGLAAFSFAGSKGAEFAKRLGFPEDHELSIAILLGYAEKPGKPHEIDMSKVSWVE